MRLSFDDEESFKEAVGSLHFDHNNPPSDQDSLQQVGSMLAQERNEDNCCYNPPSDPNVILQVRRGTSTPSQEIFNL